MEGKRGQEREEGFYKACRRQAGVCVCVGGVSPVPPQGTPSVLLPSLMQKIVLVLPRSLALTLRGSCHGVPCPR